MANATLHLGEGKGFTLPNWFLGVATACFLGVSVTVGSIAITMWADVRDNTKAVADYKARIERLEANSTDIAVVKQRVDDINGKIDWMMNHQSHDNGR